MNSSNLIYERSAADFHSEEDVRRDPREYMTLQHKNSSKFANSMEKDYQVNDSNIVYL